MRDVKRSAKQKCCSDLYMSRISDQSAAIDNIFEFEFNKFGLESSSDMNTLVKRIMSDKMCCHRLCSK